MSRIERYQRKDRGLGFYACTEIYYGDHQLHFLETSASVFKYKSSLQHTVHNLNYSAYLKRILDNWELIKLSFFLIIILKFVLDKQN